MEAQTKQIPWDVATGLANTPELLPVMDQFTEDINALFDSFLSSVLYDDMLAYDGSYRFNCVVEMCKFMYEGKDQMTAEELATLNLFIDAMEVAFFLWLTRTDPTRLIRYMYHANEGRRESYIANHLEQVVTGSAKINFEIIGVTENVRLCFFYLVDYLFIKFTSIHPEFPDKV